LATFKAFLLDEARLFIRNETIRSYITQAQKTWRKHNAAMPVCLPEESIASAGDKWIVKCRPLSLTPAFWWSAECASQNSDESSQLSEQTPPAPSAPLHFTCK
jgi:hypothetical protein